MKASLKPTAMQKYSGLDLSQLETLIATLTAKQKSTPSNTTLREISAARYALQQYQRRLKAQVMEFEASNHQHLLFFNSTSNFVKLAGHSALFFATTVADRIHWRCSLKSDTDRYCISEDGIISFRSLDSLHDRLAEINIFPNHDLTTPELHFYQLNKIYTDEQISKLRDNAHRDLERIMNIVMPVSPIPSLYDAIIQSSQIAYYSFKHLSDSTARDSFGPRALQIGSQMAHEYGKFARAQDGSSRDSLIAILQLARELKDLLAYASRIGLIHHRDTCKALDYLVSVERIATKIYLRNKKSVKTSLAG